MSEPPGPLNGVNTAGLLATIDVVRSQPELGAFQFRARCQWLGGMHSRTTVWDFSGAGGEYCHKRAHTADADYPAVVCGKDHGPMPGEYLLHALAACITAGIASIAAIRGIALGAVNASLEADMDLGGTLGASPDVRPGFSAIRVRLALTGDAEDGQLHEIVQQACARSAVFDILSRGVPISIEIRTRV